MSSSSQRRVELDDWVGWAVLWLGPSRPGDCAPFLARTPSAGATDRANCNPIFLANRLSLREAISCPPRAFLYLVRPYGLVPIHKQLRPMPEHPRAELHPSAASGFCTA